MSPPVSKVACAKCSQTITTRQVLKCSNCAKQFDLTCANVSEKRFLNTMTAEHKIKWKCQECKTNESKIDKDKTDVITSTPFKLNVLQPNGHKDDANITLRKHAKSRASPSVAFPSSPLEQTNPIIDTSELVTEFRLMREEMRAMRTEMQEFKSAMSSLTAAVNNCNRRIDDLAARVEVVESYQRNGDGSERDTTSLENIISELKMDINDRDQEMLCNDVEIAGLPEENNERCLHLALSVASKLGVSLEERDIVSAERAGPLRRVEEAADPRPRPLVVRLARRVHRDELLAGARVRRGATSAGL